MRGRSTGGLTRFSQSAIFRMLFGNATDPFKWTTPRAFLLAFLPSGFKPAAPDVPQAGRREPLRIATYGAVQRARKRARKDSLRSFLHSYRRKTREATLRARA